MGSDSSLIRQLQTTFPHVGSEDPVSYLSEVGDATHALVYAWLYWPKLVEIRGAVFFALSGNDESEISERLSSPVRDEGSERPVLTWKELVDSYNIFEIGHLFRSTLASAEDSDDLHRGLGGVLVRTWRARLNEEYPNRQFSVRLVEADESMMGIRIEVSQKAPELEIPRGWNDRNVEY
jgi:hypothetical protein